MPFGRPTACALQSTFAARKRSTPLERCRNSFANAVRGFDAAGMMTGREIVEGADLEAAIARQFANVEAQYLHIHFAAAGCYAARVDRVGQKQTSVE